MNWKISIVIAFIFFACKQEERTKSNTLVDDNKGVNINYLIEAEELEGIIHLPNIKIIDFRKPNIYKNEHIEGALNIWRSDIEDSSFPYKGMMASKAQIETLFSKLGINTTDTLIVYDDSGLPDSTRLWWILQNYDYTNVRLLNGGLSAWKTIKGTVTNANTLIKKSNFKLPNNPSMKYYASKKDMQKAVASKNVLLDTRTTNEYSGKRHKKGAKKGGRIPGSIHIDWAETIEYNSSKKFKTKQKLDVIYSTLSASIEDTIMVYCHSGVRSAHTTFVLTQLLGYKNVKNYDGSWTEWSYFEDLPFKQDSITTIK